MLRVSWIGTGAAGSPYYGTFYSAGDTAGEATVLHDAVGDFWQVLAGVINTDLTINVQSEVDVVDALTGNVTGTFLEPARAVDCAGGARLPSATQGLIRWRTGDFVGGREIRGKTFVPLPTQEVNNGGVPTTTYQQLLTDSAEGLITGAVGAGGLVVYSRTHSQEALVTAASAWNQFAVLRSRRD